MKESDSLSSYEKERLQRIAENKRLLAELQINAVRTLDEVASPTMCLWLLGCERPRRALRERS